MRGQNVAERLAVSRPGMKGLFMSGYIDDSRLQNGVPGTGTTFLPKHYSTHTPERRIREVPDAGDKNSS